MVIMDFNSCYYKNYRVHPLFLADGYTFCNGISHCYSGNALPIGISIMVV